MKFSIITPTYNRPDLLARCIDSVISQTKDKNNFTVEHIVINDSPDYYYSEVENKYKLIDNLIYIKNQYNKGNNYSHNIGLENVSDNSTHIILLDDDDWLAPNSLFKIYEILSDNKSSIDNKKDMSWIVANRVLNNGIKLTQNKYNNKIGENLKYNIIKVNYFWGYLMDYLFLNRFLNKFSGDTTHIIKKDLALCSKFSKNVKNGEEWYYFSQLKDTFQYVDIDVTISDGYAADGMTENIKGKYISNTNKLFKEVIQGNIDIYKKSKIIFYLLLRYVNIIIKYLATF